MMMIKYFTPRSVFTPVCFFIFVSLFSSNVLAVNVMSNKRGMIAGGQNALGFGYFNGPVVYRYLDESKEDYLSRYSGWLVKYVRYFGPTSALQVHYLQAHGEDDIRELSGSLIYGINLNGPGIGAYLGVSYTLKQRVQFTGTRRISNEKEYGWDYPVGLQLQNGLFTFNFETRYKYFLLNGNNIEADSVRYPFYFSVLMNF